MERESTASDPAEFKPPRDRREFPCASPRVARWRVVRHDHQCLLPFVDETEEQFDDSLARFESRLPVGSSAKMMLGSLDQRAGDGHALLLAAREFAGNVAAALQADIHQRLLRLGMADPLPDHGGGSTFSSAVSSGSRK